MSELLSTDNVVSITSTSVVLISPPDVTVSSLYQLVPVRAVRGLVKVQSGGQASLDLLAATAGPAASLPPLRSEIF